MMMEQEMKSDKYKGSSNKGYVFTLMPLYAVGVGVFAAYKFLKVRGQNQLRVRGVTERGFNAWTSHYR